MRTFEAYCTAPTLRGKEYGKNLLSVLTSYSCSFVYAQPNDVYFNHVDIIEPISLFPFSLPLTLDPLLQSL